MMLDGKAAVELADPEKQSLRGASSGELPCQLDSATEDLPAVAETPCSSSLYRTSSGKRIGKEK